VSRQQVGVGQEDRITLDMKNEVFDAVHRLQASFVSTGTPDVSASSVFCVRYRSCD
jgi:hypothetical protein